MEKTLSLVPRKIERKVDLSATTHHVLPRPFDYRLELEQKRLLLGDLSFTLPRELRHHSHHVAGVIVALVGGRFRRYIDHFDGAVDLCQS